MLDTANLQSEVNPQSKGLQWQVNFWEQSFVVIYLIIYAAGLIPVFLTNGANENESSNVQDVDFSLNRILFFFNYLVVLGLLGLRWKKTLYTAVSSASVWILIFLAPVSAIWAVDPYKTLNASIAMMGSSLFGLYLASRYSLKQQLTLLGLAFALSIILSFVLAIALPKYGMMAGLHVGKWRGIYTHKNTLGTMMVLASGALFLVASDAKKHRLFWWVIFSLGLVLIVLSSSSSALLNCVALLAAMLASRALRLPLRLLVPVVIGAIALSAALPLIGTPLEDFILGLVGKDSTLTGRTDIWSYIIDKIAERPWLGYGFVGFWNGLNGESAVIWRTLKWTVPSSHNGFLDMCLETGLFGISIFILTYIQTLIRGMKLIYLNSSWANLWFVGLPIYLVLVNLSESALFNRNSLTWVLYIALIFTASIETKNYRLKYLPDGLPQR